jgi:hypothetical protein
LLPQNNFNLQSAEPSSSNSSSAKREPCTQFLSASLANPSGGVVGGMVAGPLEAAGPVIMIIGHWEPDKQQQAGPGSNNASPAAAALAAAADEEDDDDVGGGDAVVLQNLGGVDLATAVAAAAAAAAAGAGDGQGLLGLPIEQLQGLLSAAAAAEAGDAAAAEDVGNGAVAAEEQAGAGWCGGVGVRGNANSCGQHSDVEQQQQQQQHEQEARENGDDPCCEEQQ